MSSWRPWSARRVEKCRLDFQSYLILSAGLPLDERHTPWAGQALLVGTLGREVLAEPKYWIKFSVWKCSRIYNFDNQKIEWWTINILKLNTRGLADCLIIWWSVCKFTACKLKEPDSWVLTDLLCLLETPAPVLFQESNTSFWIYSAESKLLLRVYALALVHCFFKLANRIKCACQNSNWFCQLMCKL